MAGSDKKLDRLDIRILQVLQDDARITNQALADQVGLSPSPCLQRLRKLEEAGYVGPYLARVNLERICRSVTVVATVTLRSHEQEDFRTFEEVVRVIPEVVECQKVSGTFDYLLRFVCPDIARYHTLSDELLRDAKGVAQLSSHVVLDHTKEFKGFPLDRLL